MKILIVFFLFSFCFVFSESYTITNLGILNGNENGTYEVSGINENGQIVGYSSNPNTPGDYRSFLWQNNIMIDIGTLGGDSSKAQDINNNGQITGQSATTGNASEHAFIYNISTGTRSDLGTLDGQRSLGFDINDSGQVAGQASSSEGWRAFFYNGSTMLNLGTLSGHHDSAAYGINGKGYIVGGSWPAGSNEGHAFLYNGTTMIDIGNLGGRTVAFKINDQDQVIGYSYTSSGACHGFLWQNNIMTDIGTVGGNFSSATGINNNGWIVGSSTTALGDTHAFVWKNNIISDLNSLISENSGWILTQAIAINDAGQIAGQGIYQGQNRAFLLTPNPVPEPTTLFFIILGCFVLVWKCRY